MSNQTNCSIQTNERGSENQSKKVCNNYIPLWLSLILICLQQPIKTSAKELGSRAPKKTAEDSQNVLENPKVGTVHPV